MVRLHNRGIRMNRNAIMAEPEKTTKNATIEDNPPTPGDAVSVLNFVMKGGKPFTAIHHRQRMVL